MAKFPFKLKLLAFDRDANGTPLYQDGLAELTINAMLNIDILNLASANTSSNEDIMMIEHYQAALFEEEIRLKNTVLLDNDDAFFRNMVAPHVFDTFQEMFTKETPMFFTLNVSPPPSRLNFPMLVGNNEKNLLQDLRGFLGDYIANSLRNIRFDIGNKTFIPTLQVTVESLSALLDA